MRVVISNLARSTSRYAIALVLVLGFCLSQSPLKAEAEDGGTGVAQLASSTVTAPNYSQFNAEAIDSSGNIYAVGYISAGGEYDFGNGVTLTSGSVMGALLVKYNSSGQAQWATSPSLATVGSNFNSVAVDSLGDVYAVGMIRGNSQLNFGNGVTVSDAYGSGILIVKYSASSGLAQWADSTVVANDTSLFYGVAADSSGNAYAVGRINRITGNGNFGFGNSIGVTTGTAHFNSVIVKYNSSGQAQWADTTTSNSIYSDTSFYGVAIDSSNNLIAAGSVYIEYGEGFGNGVSIPTNNEQGYQSLVVKYNSSGQAQWVTTDSSGSYTSGAYSIGVTVDPTGNIFTADNINGTDQLDFGNGVTATGAGIWSNASIVKYNSSGQAQWVTTTTEASSGSYIYGLGVGPDGYIYGVGEIDGTSQFGFGNNVVVTGTNSSGSLFIAKFNPSGVAQWATSTANSSDYSVYNQVAINSSNEVFAVGEIDSGQFDLGNNVTITGGDPSGNAILAKYVTQYPTPPSPTPSPTSTPTPSPTPTATPTPTVPSIPKLPDTGIKPAEKMVPWWNIVLETARILLIPSLLIP